MSVRFRAAWCATDLGDYRPCHATYAWYPYDSLPPLNEDRFTGSFQWFGDLGHVVPAQKRELDGLARSLLDFGLTLPADFTTFQTRSQLRLALDEVSVTGCWSDVSGPLASPVEPDAYLVRFLRDQQDCVLWYLYLRPSGETFVVNSYYLAYYLDYRDEYGEDWQEPESDFFAGDLTDEIFWCAPTFEQFAYRFWVENRLWRALHEGDQTLDADLRDYLAFYQRSTPTASARGRDDPTCSGR